jgi:hypothetical protein
MQWAPAIDEEKEKNARRIVAYCKIVRNKAVTENGMLARPSRPD